MSHNSFGRMFQVTTWGESHGPAIGCVIDGTPARLPLAESDIQPFLDRRRPGQSRFTSQRREPDRVRILSGTLDGQTTGTPIALVIENEDARERDYEEILDKYRPGHADYTYDAKYGIRDPRGGGRASARETAMRVAAGAVARKVLDHVIGSVTIRGALVQVGSDSVDRDAWDWAEIGNNPFWCPDPAAAKRWEDLLDELRKQGNSTGAVIEIVADGIPAGLGAPVYGKLDADLASAFMGINAAKGVEIGAGFGAAALTGTENADQMRAAKDGVKFLSNNAGGILGGISSGQPIVARFAVKPTSSVTIPMKTIDIEGKNTEITTKGRHDPCVGIRAVPVGEAMMACVLADHALRHRAQNGN